MMTSMTAKRFLLLTAISAAAWISASGIAFANPAAPFTHDPPGQLVDKSGKGRPNDTKVYAPSMRFPMESGPAYANSQVWGHGGMNGPASTSECDEENFSYPWHDNYCETRDWAMPLCPSGQGHQGQDIRAASCKKGVHWVVAATDGTITNVGSYSVYLTAADGTRFDYLHMSDVAVKVGDDVKRGQRLGKVSNQFGGSPTTTHLHFNIKQNVAGVGAVFVPPYTSLVASYKELIEPAEPNINGPADDLTSTPENEPPPKETTSAPLPPEEEPFGRRGDQGCASTSSSGASSSNSAASFAFAFAALGVIAGRRMRRMHSKVR